MSEKKNNSAIGYLYLHLKSLKISKTISYHQLPVTIDTSYFGHRIGWKIDLV